MKNIKYLKLPKVDSVVYERNLIELVVCELRFPTLLELERKAPEKLQKKLRKEYPHYATHERAEFNNSEVLPGHYRYIFRSKSHTWNVTVHSEAISLETSAYTNFEEFSERLSNLVEICKDLIDSDFFTRIGLRYINTIPINDKEIDNWINPMLIGSLKPEPFGSVSRFVSEIHGYTESGFYALRHGAKFIQDNEINEYFLDFDYYKEDVKYKDAVTLISEFNNINFSFFDWCIGTKAKSLMGKSTKKKKR